MSEPIPQRVERILDGEGGAQVLEGAEAGVAGSKSGPSWVSLDRKAEGAVDWLKNSANLDPLVIDALLAVATRPRTTAVGDGLIVILRGVNLNPGSDPEDMIAVRMWLEADRLITVRGRRVMALSEVAAALEAGRGPKTTSELFSTLARGLVDRAGPAIEELDDTCDRLEDDLLTTKPSKVRTDLANLRRQAIGLRRYLAPQREALARVYMEEAPWLDKRSRARIRESGDLVIRYVEDLDEVRDRAAVVQDELMNVQSEQMNKTMYVLSLVATIMLPLGFLTGLLGINVGGMPGVDSPIAFAVVCGLLLVLAVVEVLVFRWWRLL